MGCVSLSLASDFHDYYDHAFALPAFPAAGSTAGMLRRYSTGGPDKEAQFELLADLGFEVPEYQYHATHFAGRRSFPYLVVYTDPAAHRGEGKLLLPTAEAVARYPHHLACRYISGGSAPGTAESRRLLYIGERCVDLRYRNEAPGEWRSNVGDPAVSVWSIDAHPTDEDYSRHSAPLYAVDLVYAPDDCCWLAVDLNIAPGLKGTGIEALLTPTTIYTLLCDWVELRVRGALGEAVGLRGW